MRQERETVGNSVLISEAAKAVEEAAKTAAADADGGKTANPGSKDDPAKPNPPLKAGEWLDLTTVKWVKADGGTYFKLGLQEQQDHRRDHVTVEKRVFKEFLYAHASGKYEYEFDTPITQFASLICLDDTGTGEVGFIVQADGKEVYRSKTITVGHKANVSITFPPAKKLTLITDDLGSDGGDHSSWVKPKVR